LKNQTTEADQFGLQKSLPRSHYLSEEVYAREREQIFFTEWFCIGREETLSKPGDFIVLDVCGESILVVRTRSGELAGFYNVCRHRGCRLVLDEPRLVEGRSQPESTGTFPGSIRCPYHSWSYGLDGELRVAPWLQDIDDFERQSFTLHPVGVSVWGGFAFVHLSPREAESRGHTLEAQLDRVPQAVARYPLAELRSASRITYHVRANWKVVMENYNECYHCAGVHPELCKVVPAFKRKGGADLDWEGGIPHRPGAYTFTESGVSDRTPFETLSPEEKERHKGELIYPNFMLSLASEHVTAFLLWPSGPSSTWITCDFLFHPVEIAKSTFDPSDVVDFWDRVNRQDWAVCEGVQRGMTSRAFDRGYFAPMEDMSLDIRRYIAEKLGRDALED
jgi:phenylpropionate dioxygenase-like ring-hydroxylating dioxygenase large terminal subunit